MDNFNMKQWLQENKMGPYSKTLLNEINPAALGVGQEEADEEMQQQDAMRGTEVDNVSMGVVAEYKTQSGTINMNDYEITILGKDYMMDVEVDVEYHMEEPGYEDPYQISSGGIVLDNATAEIKKLAVGEEDEYREINDPAAIKQIEDLLNTDKRIKKQFEDDVADTSDFYELGAGDDYIDEAGIVGYVMKTKEADPEKKF